MSPNYLVNGELYSPRRLKILACKEGILTTRQYSWVKSMNDKGFTVNHCYRWLISKKSHKFKIIKQKYL